MPIGGVIAGEKAANIFEPGNHGTTFGGNPLAMRAGVTTIEVMEEEGLLDNATAVGGWLMDQLRAEVGQLEGGRQVRGQGLMIGIEMAAPCPDVVAEAQADGMLLNVTAGNVIRLLPPLIFSRDNAQLALDKLVPIIRRQAAKAAS